MISVLAKSVQKALSFLCNPKASQFERILPGGLSNDDDDLYLGAPAATLLYGVQNGDLSRGTLKHKVIPKSRWHCKEIVGSEE